jgi:hypothetical protein
MDGVSVFNRDTWNALAPIDRILVFLVSVAFHTLVMLAAMIAFAVVAPKIHKLFLWLCLRFDLYNSDYAAFLVWILRRNRQLTQVPRLKMEQFQRIRPTTTKATRDRITHIV